MRAIINRTKEYLAFRKQYLKEHPANHQGYWTCYYGRQWTTGIELDHDLAKSSHLDLHIDPDNIHISCVFHNRDKGSRSGAQYIEYLKNNPQKIKCSP